MTMLKLDAPAIRAQFEEKQGSALAWYKNADDSNRLAFIEHFAEEMPKLVAELDTIRKGNAKNTPVDLSLSELVEMRYGIKSEGDTLPTSLLKTMGFNPAAVTLDFLMTQGGLAGLRYLVPEIIREMLRLGLRKQTLHPKLIAGSEMVDQKVVVMPAVEMSDAAPERLGEAVSIPMGSMSFKDKTVRLYKVGKGLNISYEVIRYVKLPTLAVFFQDFGMKLGLGLDVLCIRTLLNGDQAGNAESAAAYGVTTPNTWSYRDNLAVWVRMSRMGYKPTNIVCGEKAYLDILTLKEYSRTNRKPQGGNGILQPGISLPASENFDCHGSIPDNIALYLDNTSAVMQLTSAPLLVENERIMDKQLSASYATITTGFASLVRNARVSQDVTQNTTTQLPWPAWMDVDAAESVIMDNL